MNSDSHKFTTLLILICFLNFILSCSQPVKKSFNKINDFETDSNDYDIHVVTKDSLIYFFHSDRYTFYDNFIEGFAVITKDSSLTTENSVNQIETELIVINFHDIDKIIKWGKQKKELPSFKDKTFILISVGFIGLILLWVYFQNSIKKDQSV